MELPDNLCTKILFSFLLVSYKFTTTEDQVKVSVALLIYVRIDMVKNYVCVISKYAKLGTCQV